MGRAIIVRFLYAFRIEVKLMELSTILQLSKEINLLLEVRDESLFVIYQNRVSYRGPFPHGMQLYVCACVMLIFATVWIRITLHTNGFCRLHYIAGLTSLCIR